MTQLHKWTLTNRCKKAKGSTNFSHYESPNSWKGYQAFWLAVSYGVSRGQHVTNSQLHDTVSFIHLHTRQLHPFMNVYGNWTMDVLLREKIFVQIIDYFVLNCVVMSANEIEEIVIDSYLEAAVLCPGPIRCSQMRLRVQRWNRLKVFGSFLEYPSWSSTLPSYSRKDVQYPGFPYNAWNISFFFFFIHSLII